jgi:hypothetical protein
MAVPWDIDAPLLAIGYTIRAATSSDAAVIAGHRVAMFRIGEKLPRTRWQPN